MPSMRRMVPAKQALANMTAADLRVGALTVFGEARGEPLIGMVAVSWVILNRVLIDLWGDQKPDWWGEGIEQVCKKPFAFTCHSELAENRRNREAMEAATVTDPVFLTCQAAFTAVIASVRGPSFGPDYGKDPTLGSTHYFVTGSPEPKWARGKMAACRIGNHSFFNDIEPGAPNA